LHALSSSGCIPPRPPPPPPPPLSRSVPLIGMPSSRPSKSMLSCVASSKTSDPSVLNVHAFDQIKRTSSAKSRTVL